jgi:flagellar biosynthesis protein FlhF
MTPQTFRGRTIDEARRAAQAALGPDAILLTARKVRESWPWSLFSSPNVEVAATRPEPAETSSRAPFAQAAYRTEDAERAAPRSPLPRRPQSDRASPRSERGQEPRAWFGTGARVSPVPPSLSSISSIPPGVEIELAALREAIERLSAPEIAKTGLLARFLRDAGIEGKAAASLTRTVKKTADREVFEEELRDALAGLVRVAPWPLSGKGRELIALVGPSGVGKTTTAAKLAAHAVLEQKRSVTFISCDTFRVGAFEQMERFGSLLGARVIAAATPADLRAAVAAATTDVVIVDTAGRPPGGARSVEAAIGSLSRGGRAGKDSGPSARQVLLCIPASVRAADAERFAKSFAQTAPTAIAVTKLDETQSPAGLIHAAVAAALPLGVLCFGQRVPEDVGPATMGAIFDYVLVARGRRPQQKKEPQACPTVSTQP